MWWLWIFGGVDEDLGSTLYTVYIRYGSYNIPDPRYENREHRKADAHSSVLSQLRLLGWELQQETQSMISGSSVLEWILMETRTRKEEDVIVF
jgi:hypothetical protein